MKRPDGSSSTIFYSGHLAACTWTPARGLAPTERSQHVLHAAQGIHAVTARRFTVNVRRSRSHVLSGQRSPSRAGASRSTRPGTSLGSKTIARHAQVLIVTPVVDTLDVHAADLSIPVLGRPAGTRGAGAAPQSTRSEEDAPWMRRPVGHDRGRGEDQSRRHDEGPAPPSSQCSANGRGRQETQCATRAVAVMLKLVGSFHVKRPLGAVVRGDLTEGGRAPMGTGCSPRGPPARTPAGAGVRAPCSQLIVGAPAQRSPRQSPRQGAPASVVAARSPPGDQVTLGAMGRAGTSPGREWSLPL